jgi:hypothetical protein
MAHRRLRQDVQAGGVAGIWKKYRRTLPARNNLVNHPRKIVSINGTWYIVYVFSLAEQHI